MPYIRASVSSKARKSAITLAAVLAAAALIVAYIVFLTNGPTPYTPAASGATSAKSVDLTLQTVAAVGPKLSPNENWVSYLIRENGKWVRTTVWNLPAHALVHVTVYQFDGDSGLRNPFLSQARGLVGGTFTLNGKATSRIAAGRRVTHVRDPGARRPRPASRASPTTRRTSATTRRARMANAHNTITFTFRTGKEGHYRWQCFVPVRAGFLYGFGGPMQTIGYMDGFINVV